MRRTEIAGGVVVGPQGLVVVVDQDGRSWSLPKGHIDAGETALEAAKREIYEESSVLELELVKELGSYQRHRIADEGGDDKSEIRTIHMFLFKTTQEDIEPIDPHNQEARWVEPSEVSDLLTHQADKDFFNRVKEQEGL